MRSLSLSNWIDIPRATCGEALNSDLNACPCANEAQFADPTRPGAQQLQNMEICDPCLPTFLLPISPAGHWSIREFDKLADSSDGVNVDVMHSRVPSSNPAVNAMIPVEQPLFSFVFRNDNGAAKILTSRVAVAARQFCKDISRPLLPARLNLMPLYI
jgi:hypothetical protein